MSKYICQKLDVIKGTKLLVFTTKPERHFTKSEVPTWEGW